MPEQINPVFLTSVNTLCARAGHLPSGNVRESEMPHTDPQDRFTELVAAMEARILAMETSSQQLARAFETEAGKTQMAGRKAVQVFQAEVAAAMETVYKMSDNAQKAFEKRERRRKWIDFLVCFTSVVVLVFNVIVPVTIWVLGKFVF